MTSTEENREENREFDALLEYLKHSRGFDFTVYKRPSLMRRVTKRMQMVGIESFGDYVDYLEVHPEEFLHLFNTILINVTKFFRDEASWDFIRTDIIPRVVEKKKEGEPIRVWCAGAASGEEAYTVAMLLAEALGDEQFRERCKIYATDLDEDALAIARQGTYSLKQVEDIPRELIEKYFERVDTGYTFHKDLRRSVIFGRHDLIQDAPISRIDLLVCRNTLMYFNAEAQSKILLHFHFALNDDGFLFLGKSEMLLTHTNLFTPLDLKRRVFTKAPRLDLRERLLRMTHTENEAGGNQLANHARLREAAFDSGSAAQIVVDNNGHLALANQHARALFNIGAKDLGRPLQDLEISYRPVELRSRIEQAYSERHTIVMTEVEWRAALNDTRYLNVQIIPLISNLKYMAGVSITFTDVTANRRLQDELAQSRQELETAYEELQSTAEELETTNEELQSTNEELETLNEELQSSNEELETMNEELQSTNEELETINAEMRQRTVELDQVNGFLESILTSLRVGVIVVDQNLKIQIWNHRSEDLWGLRSDEAEGQHLMSLDIGLPLEQIKHTVRACLAGENDYREIKLEATNRRGRKIGCRVVCTPLTTKGQTDGIRGAILLTEELNTDGSPLSIEKREGEP